MLVIGIVIGIFIGAPIGLVLFSFCNAAKSNDDFENKDKSKL